MSLYSPSAAVEYVYLGVPYFTDAVGAFGVSPYIHPTISSGLVNSFVSTAADGEYNDIVPTDAGTYYVKATVEETDKYTGLESDAVEFVIGKKILTNDNITKIADQTYTGEEIKPVIEVKDGDKVLVLDTDYTVAYEKNIKASEEAKAKVEIISNNYEGTLEKLFTILPKTINSEIILTAPVKNEVPQTEIETNEYTATVAWSPEVRINSDIVWFIPQQ